ncbi:MAG: toprim domain-containing protein, partial [Candidatus Sericytochromatia bacterium]
MQDLKEILNEIYSRIDREKLLSELKPQRKADYYLLECPSCHKKEAYLYDSGIYINCNRVNNCSYSKSIWDYVQENQGLSNQETLKYLADLSNYQLKNENYDEDKYLKFKEKGNLLEKALNFMKNSLWNQGKEILDYLKTRGYKEEEIKLMEVGYFPEQKTLQEYLKQEGFSTDLINNSGLNTKGMGTSHKLAIPYRDSNGVLKGFIVRSLLNDSELEEIKEKKYKYTYGLEKDSLFNIHQAKKSKDLIIVEGYLDCLIAQVRGLKGVVGTGGNTLTETQLDNAVKLGIKHFIIALDNDKAGKTGTEKAVKKISQKDLKAFVVKLPTGFKDPDELIKEEGVEAFSELVKKAESGIKWLACYLLEKHNFLSTDINRDEALEEAISYAETIFEPLLAHDYLKTVTELLEIS